MPTYNYKCDSCADIFSIRQSIKDEPLIKCDKCGGKVSRIISGNTGLIFKGSGFYLTDYARKSESKTENKTTDKPTEKKKTEKKTENMKTKSP